MNLSVNDYQNLYRLQDKVFHALTGYYGTLYLTGGTVLGRFYLNHRYSDDMDWFTHADNSFKNTVSKIRTVIEMHFMTGKGSPVLYDDFIRIWIRDDHCELKIEFVNDVPARWGEIHIVNNIPVDNPGNILSNKLSAIVGRDEPKDVFDIISISQNFSFNWGKVFEQSARKTIVAEQNVAERLATFPSELLSKNPWLFQSLNHKDIKNHLEIIADDFLFARDNSLGKGKTDILEAQPLNPK